jgi:broad specificity phosphatase PhoE
VHSTNHAVTPDIREIFCECIGRNFGNTDLAEFKNQKARVHRFIEQHLTNLPDGQRILVVAHGCLILYMLTLLTGKTFGHEMTHTGVTTLEFTSHWELASFNDSAHLYEPVATEITQALAEPVN